MIDPAKALSNPVVAVALRAALGSYVIFMSRKFYADPLGYFRKSARHLIEFPWIGQLVRVMACFCLWGGCFIIATVVAVQIFGLHGDVLAVVLIALAAIATWFLLPRRPDSDRADLSGVQNLRRPK
jgi:hypothetical protein